MRDAHRETDRGVSTVVSYSLILAIVSLFLVALVLSFAPLVTNQQASAVHSTLEVLGNDVAGDIEAVDRLATAAGPDGTVAHRTRLPDRVGGSPYRIEVAQVGSETRYEIALRSPEHDLGATVTVRTRHEIDVAGGTFDGGDLEISFDGDGLVFERA